MVDEASAQVTSLASAMADSDDSAYVLSSDWRILHVNKGWTSFAENNGGLATLRRWPVGARIDDAFVDPLREFYRDAYQAALDTGERWEHEYECSSPTEYRKFRMFVYPVAGSHLLVVNSLIVERPHPGADHACDAVYTVDGFLTMCANCRRTFNPRTNRWDWVSAYVERMPARASHGLCPACIEFYYPVAP